MFTCIWQDALKCFEDALERVNLESEEDEMRKNCR